MMDLNLPVVFYSRWAPDANTPPFSAELVTVHGGVCITLIARCFRFLRRHFIKLCISRSRYFIKQASTSVYRYPSNAKALWDWFASELHVIKYPDRGWLTPEHGFGQIRGIQRMQMSKLNEWSQCSARELCYIQ